MKEVKITEALLKEYKDDEIVHFIASELRQMVSRFSDTELSIEVAYGNLTTNLAMLSHIADAVDKRMNKVSSDPKIVL